MRSLNTIQDELENEVWRTIPGFKRYQFSSHGRLRTEYGWGFRYRIPCADTVTVMEERKTLNVRKSTLMQKMFGESVGQLTTYLPSS